MDSTQYILDVRSDEWIYMLTNLLKRKKTDTNTLQVTHGVANQTTFTVSKSVLTPAEIARLTGLTLEKAEKAHKLTLLPLGNQKEWPKPTVNYIGEA